MAVMTVENAVAKKGNTANLKPWQPGQSGNPGGMSKNLLTKDKVKSTFSRMALKPMTEIEEIVKLKNDKDRGRPALEVMVAAIIGKAVQQGDHMRLQFLLDRTIGKVKDEIDISNTRFDKDFDQVPRENIIELLRKNVVNG
jgi:hypothetical protein